MKKDLVLTEGNIPRALIAFILPLILGSLIQQLYATADAVIVGQFTGKIGLAAIDSVFVLFKFPINFMNGLSAGATILISRYFGAKDEQSLRCCVRTAGIIALFLGIFLAISGVIFAPQLLKIMSVPPDIYPQTLTYCRIYFGGIWAMVLYNMNAGILRAFGDSKRPLYALILSSCLNIAGDLLLVGVFGSGVAGAAVATVFAQVVSVAFTFRLIAKLKFNMDKQREDIAVHTVLSGNSAENLQKAEKLQKAENSQKKGGHPIFCSEHLSSMLLTGFPLALQSILFPIANSIVQASVNGMGTDIIAAWGICAKLELLIWLIADAMSPALTTYTSQNIGAKRNDRVKQGVLLGTSMSVTAVALISLILYFASGFFGSWFVSASDKADVVPLVVKFIHMTAPFYVFYAVAEAFTGACCGLGDTLKPMLTTLATVCVLRVVGIFFVLPIFNTMECIIWIYITSWIAAGLSFTIMYVLKQKSLSC